MAENEDRTDGNRDLASDGGLVQHFPTEVGESAAAARFEESLVAERAATVEREAERRVRRTRQLIEQRETQGFAQIVAQRTAERAAAAERRAAADRALRRELSIVEVSRQEIEAADSAVARAINSVAEVIREGLGPNRVAEIATAQVALNRSVARVMESELVSQIVRRAAGRAMQRAEVRAREKVAAERAEERAAAAERDATANERTRRGEVANFFASIVERLRRRHRAEVLEERARRDARPDFLDSQRRVREAAETSRLLVEAASSAIAVTREPSVIERITAAATASAVARLEAEVSTTEIAAATSAAITAEVARLAAGCLNQLVNLAAPISAARGPLTQDFLRMIIESFIVSLRGLEDLAATHQRTVRDLESGRSRSAPVSIPRTETELPQRIGIERSAFEGSSNESGSQAKRMKCVTPLKESSTVVGSSMTEPSSTTLSPPEEAKSSLTKDSSPERLPPKSSDKPSKDEDDSHENDSSMDD